MKSAILLVNLGTPDAPTTPAVRRYLKEFLSDPRVVEIPRAVWWLILRLFILPFRPGQSARKYASIWTADGSPLKVWTQTQAKLLRGLMGERGHDVVVDYAMRYGAPAIPDVLARLKADGCDRILVLPLYPQYSAATTASTFDAIQGWAATQRDVPEFRFVKQYHDDPGYIAALATRIARERSRDGSAAAGATLLMSFHGIPQRSVKLGDPYQAQCLETARLLAARLNLAEGQWQATFQSRFGRAAWLQPYTVEVAKALGAKKTPAVSVCCPGFPADCLETLEEIAMEVRTEFLHAGGGAWHYIPCLDDEPAWIAALAGIAERNMHPWLESGRPRG